MTGFVPVDIPTKKYIKAYVLSKLGKQPVMNTETNIGSKLYDLLQHQTNERKNQFCSSHYTELLRIYIPVRTFRRRGSFLNESNTKNFNIFLERELKNNFYEQMNMLILFFPSFENNLPEVRKRLGIDIEAWSDDSMKKDYYRYRKRMGVRLFYSKQSMP